MDKLMRLLAAALLAATLLAGGAFAEADAPAEPEFVDEVGEFDLLPEVAAPEAPAEDAPMAAEAPEEPPAKAPAEPAAEAVEAPAEETAVAAPAAFPGELTLGVKEQFALNGADLAGGEAVTYVSSKPKLVAVDANGVVTARKKGSAVITVYQGETALAACNVTVLKAPGKLTFPEKKNVVISKDQVRPFAAILPKNSAGAISYASDNPAVMTVDAAGNLYGVSGGTANVTATAYNGKKVSCSVRVLGGPAPSTVALNLTSVALPVKGTAQLAATFDEGCDAILTYATSNKKIAVVNENGVITARKAGQATITVTTHNGLTAACEVQVYVAPKKVTLSLTKLTMRINEGYQLFATLTKNSYSELTWTSDNPGVASVDGNGFVAANDIGQANITVTTSNGKKATCKVTVLDPNSAVGPGELVFQESKPTMKVSIYNDHEMILAYVWVADPSRQLNKHYFQGKTMDILNDAVARNGLQNQLVLGFNASPPCNENYCAAWNKKACYRHREPAPLLITNGEVLANEPGDVYTGMYIYWMDGDGWLHATDKTLDQYSTEERQALYQSIIASGARNTAIWRPCLIRDYQAVPFTEKFIKKTNWKQKKHALCQIDQNNFIIVTSTNKGLMDYPHFQSYLMGLGVKTAIEFDAGASASFMYKASNANKFYKFVSGRPNTSMMYFCE